MTRLEEKKALLYYYNSITDSIFILYFPHWQSMIRGLQGIGSPYELFILFLVLSSLPRSQTENFSTYLRHCSFNAKFMASDIYFVIILNLVITKEWFGFFCGPILDICSC